MDEEKKSQIISYIRNQLTLSEQRLKELTFDSQGNKLPYRDAYHTIKNYIGEFTKGESEPRWLALAGLRGVGKTTVLAQLFTDCKWEGNHKLYLSLDQTTNLGFSLTEILAAYEEFLGVSLEMLKNPILLLLDEVQYQENWAITAKTIYDRTNKVFILATGSSALSLQTNADVSRRMVLEKIYPLGFAEYAHAKFKKKLPEGLSERLKSALFFSATPEEVYKALRQETAAVNTFWTGIERFEIDRYSKFGTLPFAIRIQNESTVYKQISQVMDAVIEKDVAKLNAFDKQTLPKLAQLLYALSGADIVSIVKLADTTGLDPRTVTQALDAFEKTEVLLRILPYGAHYSQVKKPSKYLFTSSAYRAMYYNLVGSVEQYENYKGKLLEDVIGMYLMRLFGNRFGITSLTYDSAQSGADFILETKPRGGKIVIEAGMGKKKQRGFDQVVNTLSKVQGKYGLVISQGTLAIEKQANCVAVPLEYFFLL